MNLGFPLQGDAYPPPSNQPQGPTVTLGKYQLTKLIGKGGMGEVWQAKGPFEHDVAVKILNKGAVADKDQLARFRIESMAMSKLKHKNICRILDVGQSIGITGPSAFIVMDLLEGLTLAEILDFTSDSSSLGKKPSSPETTKLTEISSIIKSIKNFQENPLPESDQKCEINHKKYEILPVQLSLTIILKICDAIQYAHEKGIFHRDIKPANIFIQEDGEPIVLDFGLAKFKQTDEKSLSREGDVFGTLEYMAPEQARSSKEVDERSDLYGIASILYQMLCGEKSFRSSGNIFKDILRLQSHEPVNIKIFNPKLDEELQIILMKALQSEASARYLSVQQFSDDLRRYLQGIPILARKMGILHRAKKLTKRHRISVNFSIIIFLLLSCFGAFWFWEYQKNWGNWSLVYQWDASKDPIKSGLIPYSPTLSKTNSIWVSDSKGLSMKPMEWLLIEPVKISGNIRVIAKFSIRNNIDAFEICLNAKIDSMKSSFFVPSSYSFQIGGYLGKTDFISINQTPSIPFFLSSAPSLMRPNQELEIQVERVGENVRLFTNGKLQAQENDLLPFCNQGNSNVLLRSMADSLKLLSLKVYSLGMPEKTTPLVTGEVMNAYGFKDAAIDYFEGIESDFHGSRLAEKALIKAYLIETGKLHSETKKEKRLYKKLRLEYPLSDRQVPALEAYTLKCLFMERTDEAMELLKQVLKINPKSTLVLQFLKPTFTNRLNEEQVLNVFSGLKQIPHIAKIEVVGKNIERTNTLGGLNISELSLKSCNLKDLSGIKASRLQSLDLSGNNKIVDYDALQNLPLIQLKLNGTNFKQWGILNKFPLKSLGLNNLHVQNLDILPKNVPLEILTLGQNEIQSLQGIEIYKLHTLMADANNIKDISALATQSELEYLSANGNLIRDISALKNLPLNYLSLSYNQISNCNALSGRSIEKLFLTGNPLSDFNQVQLPKLTKLVVNSCEFTNLDFLANMPFLTSLFCNKNKLSSIRGLKHVQLEELHFGGLLLNDFSMLFSQPNLKSLNLFGSNIWNLEQIPGSKMEKLRLENSKLENIKGIQRFNKLKELDFSQTRVSSLQGIEKLPLTKLAFRHTPVSNLEPILNLKSLKYLNLEYSKVIDLQPIAKLNLDYLNISGLKIHKWFNAPWPAETHFYKCGLSLQELKQFIKKWEKDATMKNNWLRANLYYALESEDFSNLKNLTNQSLESSQFLFFPIAMTYAKAQAIARKSGGQLAIFRNDLSLNHLVIERKGIYSGWVSQKDSVTGRLRPCVSDNELRQCPESEEKEFLIEWK